MNNEYILGWLETQIVKMDKEILNLEKWVTEAQADLEKSIESLSGFQYRLEETKSLRLYLDELKGKNQ